MSKESTTYRVIQILKDLDDGKLLSVENLAYKYDTSQRSIRRDFELIKKIYGDILISPKKGCYQAISKTLLQNTLNSTELYMLKNILKLSDKSKLSLTKNIDNNIKKAIIKEEENSPYLFKQKPYEEIFIHREKFKKLEYAVKYKKEIEFKYTNLDKISYFIVKPYKILFINENFYLASQNKDNKFTLSRIALMDEIKETNNSFLINIDMMDFIYFMQSPWATYKENFRNHLKKVIITIPKREAKYFKLKKFMPSQEIIDEDKHGTITICFTVSSENEVSGLIKQWIPYVNVIYPRNLVNIFKKVARRFYNKKNV